MSSLRMLAIRRRILGVALRNARASRDRTPVDLARVLQCEPERVSGYERGEKDLSLPEIEALAVYLCLPAQSLLSAEISPDGAKTADTPQTRKLRDRIIGALLRRARQGADKSLDDVAAHLGCAIDDLQAYERGQASIPVASLLVLAEYLDTPWEEMAGRSGNEEPPPVSGTDTDASVNLGHLTSEMVAFLSDPANLVYVKAGMALSRISGSELKGLAETLLAVEGSD